MIVFCILQFNENISAVCFSKTLLNGEITSTRVFSDCSRSFEMAKIVNTRQVLAKICGKYNLPQHLLKNQFLHSYFYSVNNEINSRLCKCSNLVTGGIKLESGNVGF